MKQFLLRLKTKCFKNDFRIVISRGVAFGGTLMHASHLKKRKYTTEECVIL